jgi:hypothetical protein
VYTSLEVVPDVVTYTPLPKATKFPRTDVDPNNTLFKPAPNALVHVPYGYQFCGAATTHAVNRFVAVENKNARAVEFLDSAKFDGTPTAVKFVAIGDKLIAVSAVIDAANTVHCPGSCMIELKSDCTPPFTSCASSCAPVVVPASIELRRRMARTIGIIFP